MGLHWTPWALIALLVSAGWLSLGVLVYLVRPYHVQNRLLGVALLVGGLSWGWVALRWSVGDPRMFYAAFVSAQVGWLLVLVAYLAFLGTLDTPLSRPLGTPLGRALLALVAAGGSAAYVGWTEAFWPAVEAGTIGRWVVEFSPWGDAAWILIAAGSLYGLLVAASMYRRADPGSRARSQARAYVAAFGCRDVAVLGAVALATLSPNLASWPLNAWQLNWVLWFVGDAGFALLLAYGILQWQLFDIELKVKWGVERSTLVGAFGVTFLAVSEATETLLGVDGTLYGVLAAVSIGLFFRRIEAAAEHLADRLMPGVEDTPEYRQRRREEIYRAQLEELLSDEQVTAKERRALLRLQEDLGLSGDDANQLEREVLGVAERRA